MPELVKRRIVIEMDCEYITDSPVFGAVTPELVGEWVKEQLSVMLVEGDIHPEEGDIFRLSNPCVIMNPEQDVTDDTEIPTDDESILREFALNGVDAKYLEYERAIRELENKGWTRSDAQGATQIQHLNPDSLLYHPNKTLYLTAT